MAQVSVIIPVYNVEKYLSRCLDSLLAQTFTDFEVICVNDGSTDGSGQVLQTYAEKDARIKIITQENRGVSAARNVGLRAVDAPYVCFVDADDYAHPEMLSCLIEVMEKVKADIANCLIVKTSAEEVVAFQPLRADKIKTRVFADPLEAFMKNRRIQTGSYARLYKKEILSGIRFEPNTRYEDIPFAVQVMNKAKSLVLVYAPLYVYYQHSESFIHQPFSEEKAADYFKVMRLVWAYCQQNCPQRAADVRRYILNSRFKMLTNQAVRRQKDKAVQRRIFALVQQTVKEMYQEKMLSYEGLKLKHKIRLFLLLHCRTPEPCRVWSNLI